MNAKETELYGLIAEFAAAPQLLEAAKRACAAGYSRLEAYSPYPVDGLSEALGFREKAVAPAALAGGLFGGAAGFFMQYYANVIGYPLNIGGRPHDSWPAFIPITFELTVLGAGLAALAAVFWRSRLPKLHHPVFNAPGFERVTQESFFLCIEAGDPRFETATTRSFLEATGARQVTELRP